MLNVLRLLCIISALLFLLLSSLSQFYRRENQGLERGIHLHLVDFILKHRFGDQESHLSNHLGDITWPVIKDQGMVLSGGDFPGAAPEVGQDRALKVRLKSPPGGQALL